MKERYLIFTLPWSLNVFCQFWCVCVHKMWLNEFSGSLNALVLQQVELRLLLFLYKLHLFVCTWFLIYYSKRAIRTKFEPRWYFKDSWMLMLLKRHRWRPSYLNRVHISNKLKRFAQWSTLHLSLKERPCFVGSNAY